MRSNQQRSNNGNMGYKEGGYQKSYMSGNNYNNRQYYDNGNINSRGGSGHIKSYQGYGYSHQPSYDNQQQRRKSFKDGQQSSTQPYHKGPRYHNHNYYDEGGYDHYDYKNGGGNGGGGLYSPNSQYNGHKKESEDEAPSEVEQDDNTQESSEVKQPEIVVERNVTPEEPSSSAKVQK